MDIRSSGKTSFTGPKSNLPERIIEIDIIYKKVFLTTSDGNLIEIDIIYIVDVVEWSRALDVRLSEWCCSVSMVWVQIPSREEQKFDSSKI